ncbi:hypothetical protein [Mycoplasma sp. Z1473D]
MKNNPLDFFHLNKKPLSSKTKKTLVGIFVFSIFLLFTLLMLLIPFKDGSTFEILLGMFQSNNWNSANISQLVSAVGVWIFFAWGFTLKVSQTLTLRKYKKKMKEELFKKEDLTLSKEEIKEKKQEMLKTYIKNESKIDKLINLLATTLIKLNHRVDANTMFEIRDILESLNDSSKIKRHKITQLLQAVGIDTETKELKSVINQI